MNVTNLTPADIVSARQRIAGRIRLTEVMTSSDIDRTLGMSLFFKCEHLQITGSFKLRGASHAVSLLSRDCPGVATHSSGNHGAALARAAGERGIEAHIVMPDNAVTSKIKAVRALGGEVHFCAPNQAARETGLAALVARGFEPIPPYDDDRIIAGQGSCALELFEQVPDLDAIIAPVGGGGLLAGTALATRVSSTQVRVFGAEPAGADDTCRSLAAGHRVTDHDPQTIADGLRALVGVRNLAIISEHVEKVIAVPEPRIIEAMELIWSCLKQVVEPSGAVALAGLMQGPEAVAGKRIGVILSGGNLDIGPMIKCLS
jgi:threonine dehydratase